MKDILLTVNKRGWLEESVPLWNILKAIFKKCKCQIQVMLSISHQHISHTVNPKSPSKTVTKGQIDQIPQR